MILRFKNGTPETEVLAVESEVAHAGGRSIRSDETRRPILAVVDKLPKEVEAKIMARDSVEDRVNPPGAWHQAHRSFRDTPTVVQSEIQNRRRPPMRDHVWP